MSQKPNALLNSILALMIVINGLLAFSGIWLHWTLHIDPSGVFYTETFLIGTLESSASIWMYVALVIGALDIIAFSIIRRNPFISFFANIGFFLIGLVAMVLFVPQTAPMTEIIAPATYLIIDLIIGFIAYRIVIETGVAKQRKARKQRSRRPS